MNATTISPSRPFLPPSRAEVVATRARDFASALLARARSGSDWSQAEGHARNSSARAGLVARASVPAMGAGDNDALNAYTETSAAWLETLRSDSVFDAALPDMRQVPMHTRGAIVTQGFAAGIVAAGHGKPVATLTVAVGEALQPRKAVGLTAATRELLRQPGARELLELELRQAVGRATDATFLAELIAATTPISSPVLPADDLRALLGMLRYGANARLYWVVPPSYAAHIANDGNRWPEMTYVGGTMAGIKVIVSDALPLHTAIMFDASQIVANAGTVELDASDHADLQLDSAPTQDATVPTASNLVSMFQTNSTALRLERSFGFKLMRATAAASLSGL